MSVPRVPGVRRIDGRLFYLERTTPYRNRAGRIAVAWRAQGYFARVVRDGGPFSDWKVFRSAYHPDR